jgi:adenosine deaminase
MREAGLLVTLNTDDPALIDLDLAQEHRLTAEAFDDSWGDLVGLSMNAVEACWLDEVDKAALPSPGRRPSAGRRPSLAAGDGVVRRVS